MKKKKRNIKKATAAFFLSADHHFFPRRSTSQEQHLRKNFNTIESHRGNPAIRSFIHPSDRSKLRNLDPKFAMDESALLLFCTCVSQQSASIRDDAPPSKIARDKFSRYRAFLSTTTSDKLLSNDDFRRASSLSLSLSRIESRRMQANRFLTPLKLEWDSCVFPWRSVVRFSKDVTPFRIESNDRCPQAYIHVASVAHETRSFVALCCAPSPREKVKGTIDIHCAR